MSKTPLSHYLSYAIDNKVDPAAVTNYGGVFPYLDLILLTDLPGMLTRELPAAPARGWQHAEYIAALLALNLTGGDCVDDLGKLSDDAGIDLYMGQIRRRWGACYKKYDAYSALLVRWAETGLVVWDEFRNGNVPPAYRNQEALVESITYLNTELGITDVWVRSDAAACQLDLLETLATWQVDGEACPVRFAIGYIKSDAFRAAKPLGEDNTSSNSSPIQSWQMKFTRMPCSQSYK